MAAIVLGSMSASSVVHTMAGDALRIFHAGEMLDSSADCVGQRSVGMPAAHGSQAPYLPQPSKGRVKRSVDSMLSPELEDATEHEFTLPVWPTYVAMRGISNT